MFQKKESRKSTPAKISSLKVMPFFGNNVNILQILCPTTMYKVSSRYNRSWFVFTLSLALPAFIILLYRVMLVWVQSSNYHTNLFSLICKFSPDNDASTISRSNYQTKATLREEIFAGINFREFCFRTFRWN